MRRPPALPRRSAGSPQRPYIISVRRDPSFVLLPLGDRRTILPGYNPRVNIIRVKSLSTRATALSQKEVGTSIEERASRAGTRVFTQLIATVRFGYHSRRGHENRGDPG